MRCRPSSPAAEPKCVGQSTRRHAGAWYRSPVTRKIPSRLRRCAALLLPAQADEPRCHCRAASRVDHARSSASHATSSMQSLLRSMAWASRGPIPKNAGSKSLHCPQMRLHGRMLVPGASGSGPNSASRFQPRSVGKCEIASRSSDSSCHKSSGELTPPEIGNPFREWRSARRCRSCPSTGCRRVPCDQSQFSSTAWAASLQRPFLSRLSSVVHGRGIEAFELGTAQRAITTRGYVADRRSHTRRGTPNSRADRRCPDVIDVLCVNHRRSPLCHCGTTPAVGRVPQWESSLAFVGRPSSAATAIWPV